MMDRVGSWGTDLELFFSSPTPQNRHLVFKDTDNKSLLEQIFRYGFNDRHNVHELPEKRLSAFIFQSLSASYKSKYDGECN